MFPGDDEPRVPEPGDEEELAGADAGDDDEEFEAGLTEEFERMERELDDELAEDGEWESPDEAEPGGGAEPCRRPSPRRTGARGV